MAGFFSQANAIIGYGLNQFVFQDVPNNNQAVNWTLAQQTVARTGAGSY